MMVVGEEEGGMTRTLAGSRGTEVHEGDVHWGRAGKPWEGGGGRGGDINHRPDPRQLRSTRADGTGDTLGGWVVEGMALRP